MKNFKNPAPLQYNIEDADGKPIILTSVLMTPKMFQRLDKAAVDEKLDAYDKGLEQMAIIFGGKATDYANINQLIIKAVINDWQNEISNPILESREKPTTS